MAGNKYTNMKVFHFKEKVDSLPLSAGVLAPIHVRVKPTNRCNHRCSYCAYRAKGLQLGEDMQAEDFIPKNKMMELLDDFENMGVKALTFSGGGEPFCYPYLLETVKKLSKTNIKFATLTNGSLLKCEIAKIFANHATWVRVSMDGWDDHSYAEQRNVREGEFSNIIKNIRDFIDISKECSLGVSIIVGQKNANHVLELMRILAEIGVDNIKISPCIISNNSQENYEYHQPIQQVVKDQIKQAKQEFSNLEIYDSYNAQLTTFDKSYTWCPHLQVLTVIGADCNVYSCQDKAYNLREGLLGSLKDQRFRDLWFSDKTRFFKINPSVHCNHHCVADEKNKRLLEYLNVDLDNLDFV